MANRLFTQFQYSLHKAPVALDCSFTVASTDSAGLGITGLTGAGIKAVYMHTSATPAAGNPNPDAGTIIIQFQDTYFKFFGMDSDLRSPSSGTPLAITAAGANIVAGTPYIISAVGTSTLADFRAIGLPIGITPAIGVAFIGSSTTGSGTGTGFVQVARSAGAGIDHLEIVGNPSLTIGAGSSAPFMILNCNLSLVKTQPADGTVIDLHFLLSNSSILVSGE
jgi:hypothetical protein